jgi:AcrR family transcriptional regulator
MDTEHLSELDAAARQPHVLRIARHILREEGYDALTVKALAKRSGLSRMTVYRHLGDRHDIVMRLAIQSTARRADMIERAASFKGTPRERFVAIISVMRELLPHHMRHELLVFERGVWAKASPDLLRRLQANQDRHVAAMVGVVRDAVAVGDVTLPANLPPEKLGLSFVHLELGGQLVMQGEFAYGRFTASDSQEVLFAFGADLLDSLGWRPLYCELDYVEMTRRMWRELFPEELKKFGIKL